MGHIVWDGVDGHWSWFGGAAAAGFAGSRIREFIRAAFGELRVGCRIRLVRVAQWHAVSVGGWGGQARRVRPVGTGLQCYEGNGGAKSQMWLTGLTGRCGLS
jgi:hypothetical protein